MRLLLVSIVTLLLIPSAFAQQGALPEVLLVVDTSQSMQFKVGSNTVPSAGRWTRHCPMRSRGGNIIREVIGGSFGQLPVSV